MLKMSKKLYSALDRSFFLTGRINNERTRELLEWLLEQYMLDTKQPIELHIMSYGGDVNLAFAIIDFLQQSPRPLATYALGVCHSSAFLLFASGTRGMRYAGPNATFMCHQHHNVLDGKHHDLVAAVLESKRTYKRMVDHLAKCAAMQASTVEHLLMDRSDHFFTPQQVVDLGLADVVIPKGGMV